MQLLHKKSTTNICINATSNWLKLAYSKKYNSAVFACKKSSITVLLHLLQYNVKNTTIVILLQIDSHVSQ